MEILVLANKMPYPPKDGGALATFNLCSGLAQAGARVCVLAMNTRKHRVAPEDIPAEVGALLGLRLVELDTTPRPAQALLNLLFSRKPYNATRFEAPAYAEALRQLLAERAFDLVQLEGLYLAPYVPMLRALAPKARVVMRAHNVEHEIWQRTAALEKSLPKRLYLKLLARRIERMERRWLPRYDALVPITARDGQRFLEMGYAGPSLDLPVGYVLPPESPPPSSGEAFHLGALDWTPNQEGLLWLLDKVWPLVRAARPESLLHVAGRNAPPWLVQRLRAPGVVFHGEVPDARGFMLAHGPMVVPLFSGSGMRVKIVEGMALAKAIVSTPIGIEGIPARDGRELRVAQAPEAFAQALLELLRSPARAADMGQAAHQFARQRLDSLALARQLLAFYQRL